MSSLLEQARYRVKAILAATFIALVGVAEWVIQNPDTASAVQAVVPAPFTQFVPIVLGALGTVLVHQIPLGEQPAPRVKAKTEAPVTELADTPATTAIATQAATRTGEASGDDAY